MVLVIKCLLILVLSVFGQTDIVDSFGYEVSILYQSSYICGGAIISPNYVITAAHCTDGSSSNNLWVRTCSSSTPINILRVHQHPNYNPFTMEFDLSILYLNATLEDTSVKLPQENQPLPIGAHALLSSCNFEPTLQEIVDSSQCYVAAGYSFCARRVEGGEVGCKGDSGSPLVVNGELLGVLSWGYNCVQDLPNVYTNIASLRRFIEGVTGVYLL